MPSEGSHPQVPLPPAGGPRRQKRRWLWPSCSQGCCSDHSASTGTPPREHKDSTLTGRRGRRRWFSVGKLRRSFSIHGAMSMVAPEVDVEDREGCGDGNEETTTSREIVPAIIVQSVRPTFLQRLFPKGGRERKSKNKTEARRTVPSQSTCSEIVPHPCPLGDNLTVPLPSFPIEEGGNNHNARELHECHSSSCTTMMARTATHSQSKNRACKSIRKHDSLAGFVILIVILLMLGMGGRIFAMISTSAFFYLASYFRGGPTVVRGGEGNIRSKEKRYVAPVAAVDYESQQYRKKVLMEGILRRDGRR